MRLLVAIFLWLPAAAGATLTCADLPGPREDVPGGAEARRVRVDEILVDKTARRLHVYFQGRRVKSYPVALGMAPGRKRQEGDLKTPEGRYRIDQKRSRSEFRKGLHLDYPNAEDREWARKNKVKPGGAILIHGLPEDPLKRALANHPHNNWTHGCLAVDDDEIDELFASTAVGTPVLICP